MIKIIELKLNSTSTENYTLTNTSIKEVDTISSTVFLVEPPTPATGDWTQVGSDLYSSSVLVVDWSKKSTGRIVIKSLFDPTAIVGSVVNQYYGVNTYINKADEASIPQEEITTIYKIVPQYKTVSRRSSEATGLTYSGATGLQGVTGIQGLGETGIQGVTGIEGVTGLDGAVAAKGDTGLQGIQGVTGLIGVTGIDGLQGDQGDTGIDGIQGITGLIGETGIQGVTGLIGETGAKGDQGDTGIDGIQGLQGDTGIDGLVGETGIQGIQGITGLIGETGIQGITGLQGIQGDQGDTGVQGTQGDTGTQGIQGVTGLIGETGIQGITGLQGIQGDQGDTGIQGVTGLSGELSKSIAIEVPSSAEDITMWKTKEDITVSTLYAVLVGPTSPSVTWTIRFNADRNATGTEIVTGGTTTTSTTTGDTISAFDDATIPAGSWIWVETTAESGVVNLIDVTVFYTND